MPFVLLEVSSEIAIKELCHNQAVQVLWVEPLTASANTLVAQKQELRPLLVEPYNEQALEVLRQLEKLGILRILPSNPATT